MPALRILPIVVAVLGLSVSCATAPEDLQGTLSELTDTTVDPLAEAAEAGPAWESTSPEFCAEVAALTSATTLTLEQVIDRYRNLLPLAPPEIAAEIAALLDYLTTGAPPEFAEGPLETGPRTSDPLTSDRESSPPADAPDRTSADTEPDGDDFLDDVVYGTGDAEQVAVMMAEFLEFHCRGTAVSPLPPPSGRENQSDN